MPASLKKKIGRDRALRSVLYLLLSQLRKSPPEKDLLLFWRVNLWLLATFGLWECLVLLLSLFYLRLSLDDTPLSRGPNNAYCQQDEHNQETDYQCYDVAG